jgi:hypothetical protein
MRTLIVVATAAVALTLASGSTSAGFCANPASNFSAYYYQSPGGVGRNAQRQDVGPGRLQGARGPL